jgi:hypothetical protein
MAATSAAAAQQVQSLLVTLDDNISTGTEAIEAFLRANPGTEVATPGVGIEPLRRQLGRWTSLRKELLSIQMSGTTLTLDMIATLRAQHTDVELGP